MKRVTYIYTVRLPQKYMINYQYQYTSITLNTKKNQDFAFVYGFVLTTLFRLRVELPSTECPCSSLAFAAFLCTLACLCS